MTLAKLSPSEESGDAISSRALKSSRLTGGPGGQVGSSTMDAAPYGLRPSH